MPGNPHERQPRRNRHSHRRSRGEGSSAGQKPALEFQAYQGTHNFPTWNVYAVMTSDYDTYRTLERIADQGTPLSVRKFVTGTVEQWKEHTFTPHAEEARMLVQSFLMNGVRRVEWTPVYDTLRGERKELGEANALTSLTYDLLSRTDWQSIVKDAEYLTQADDMLRSWVEDQCLTWITSPDARKHTGSVGRFANTVLDIYFQAVQWEKVYEGLKGK
jgi:hypothetical protein